MRIFTLILLFVLAFNAYGSEEIKRIPVSSYLDVNIEIITANEWKYFIGEKLPNKELEHPAKRVSASINLNDDKNKSRIEYLKRVIETSIMELEIRDGYKLVAFTEIKPKTENGIIEWSAEFSANKAYKVVLWLRYSYTSDQYPFMAERSGPRI